MNADAFLPRPDPVNASALHPITALRLQLHRNGYRPVPVSDPNPMLSTAGKAPCLKNWPEVCAQADEAVIRGWERRPTNHSNTGLLTGDLIGMDLDLPVPALAERIRQMAEEMVGPTPLLRIGKAPKVLRCYRAEAPLPKIETPELLLDDGTVVQIEIMGEGQQVLAYGTHPGTGRPYTWPESGPDLVPLADLPVATETQLRAFVAAAEIVLREAGGRTKKEREQAEQETEDGPPDEEPPPYEAEPSVGKSTGKGGDKGAFFREVNKRALANIQPWFTALFPNARREENTGCWRVASADLGRSLQEDISVHPQEGGQDFGTRESCSPVDLVMEWGGAPKATDAAFFICEKLGIAPADCGWKPKRERPKAAPPEARDSDGPTIRVVAGELHIVATEGEAALLSAGVPIYQRGHGLVRPVMQDVPAAKGRMTITAALVELSLHSLIDALCASATWEKYDARAEAWVRIDPPKKVADTILSRVGFWTFPKIVGVVTTPTIRPDGSVLSAAGYDPATRLYHAADDTIRLSDAVARPSRKSAEAALKLLSDLLEEFPFVNAVSKAVALSGLITPVVRGALQVAPMHVFRASTAGTGKSYLADTASAIAAGRPCPVAAAGPDEIETEKRVAGLLLAGFPLISLDNINGELGGDLLCQAIERPLIRLRPLGRSDIVEIESRATIFGTGNGLRVRGDMTRRTLTCDLDAGMERPELRQFKADPVATVMEDRGRYVSGCLVIVRAYIAAGRPGLLPPIASFAEWSDLVRSALVWLRCADPAESMEQARDDDPELSELREIVAIWRTSLPVNAPLTCKQIVDHSEARKLDEHERPAADYLRSELRDLLVKLAGDRNGVSTNRLGAAIRKHAGRIVDSHRIIRLDVASPVAQWKLEPVK